MEQTQLSKNTMDSEWEEPPIDYKTVPWSEKASLTDKWLEGAHDWLVLLEHPNDINDQEYTLIIWYMSDFFTNSNVLWKCDA